jgi:uncharacterized ubiquitin-like protein YukD
MKNYDQSNIDDFIEGYEQGIREAIEMVLDKLDFNMADRIVKEIYCYHKLRIKRLRESNEG